MAVEHLRQTNRIRTDINADRPSSAKAKKKKKKKIEATLKSKVSESEEESTDRQSFPSSKPSTASSTPRATKPHIDHHIKYTDNEKLRRWLKEKDRIYRKQVREERRKKREEREKLIDEANDKLERRIKSQKQVSYWKSFCFGSLFIIHIISVMFSSWFTYFKKYLDEIHYFIPYCFVNFEI